jgi:hypothetical protein
LVTVTWRSAPGRAFSPVIDEPPNPSHSQPPSSRRATPTPMDLCITTIVV